MNPFENPAKLFQAERNPQPQKSFEQFLNIPLSVRKISLREGNMSGIPEGATGDNLFLGAPLTIGGRIVMKDNLGEVALETTSIQSIREAGSSLIVETRTSEYQIEIQPQTEPVLESGAEKTPLKTVENIQQGLANFNAYCQHEKARFRPDFYQYTSSGEFSPRIITPEKQALLNEQEASHENYEELLLSVFRQWKESLLRNWDETIKKHPEFANAKDGIEKTDPKSLEDLYSLYGKAPAFNTHSALHFQGGFYEGNPESNFTHFFGGAMSGYKYERGEETRRIYLNPPRSLVPALVTEFIERAQAAEVEFYFKITNPTKSDISARSRLEGIVFYTNPETEEKVIAILKDICSEKPEALKSRLLPPLTEKVVEGIGVGDEPNKYQKENLEGKSFNFLRAKFLEELLQEVGAQILRVDATKTLKNGKTVKEIILSHIEPKDTDLFRRCAENNFELAKLEYGDKHYLERVLRNVMLEVIPHIDSVELQGMIDIQIDKVAVKYQIDPYNLAKNKG